MAEDTFPPLDITQTWRRMNDGLVTLVDYIPEDQLDWSPKPELYNFRGILIHIAMARHNSLANVIQDGEQTPDLLREGQTKEGAKEQLRLSWERLERFLSNPEKLSTEYTESYEGDEWRHTGHWIAYHLLEHDIHHRADIFHYLALLGIEHPDIGTP